MSANRGSLASPRLWLSVGLALAVLMWVAQVALTVWMTFGGSPFYGLPGLAATGVALVAFRWLTRSWAQAFFWSALVGFVFVLGLIAATFSVY